MFLVLRLGYALPGVQEFGGKRAKERLMRDGTGFTISGSLHSMFCFIPRGFYVQK